MPRAEQAEYQRVRWSLYLDALLAAGGPTRARFADALELPTSRVSQWLAGERGVEAGTAFVVGERLRETFGVRTSGCEALYAAGYFADLLRLLREAALEDRGPARERAVALYCSLPRRFLASEIRALDGYARTVDGYRESEFEHHEAARLRRDAELAATRTAHDAPSASLEIDAELMSHAAVEQFRTAWQRAQHPLDLPRVVIAPPMPMPGAAASSRAVPAAVPVPAVTRIAPLDPPPVEAIAALIDVIIALARALESRNPTLTAPRLWRMLAEWAFELAPSAFERYAPLLPEAYAHFATR